MMQAAFVGCLQMIQQGNYNVPLFIYVFMMEITRVITRVIIEITRVRILYV